MRIYYVYILFFLLSPFVNTANGQNKDSIQLVVPPKVNFNTGFISPNGQYLYTYTIGDYSYEPLIIWDVASGKQIVPPIDYVHLINRICHDSFLVFKYQNETVIWDCNQAKIHQIVPGSTNTSSIIVSPNGNLFAVKIWEKTANSVGQNVVRIINPYSGKVLLKTIGRLQVQSAKSSWIIITDDSIIHRFKWSNLLDTSQIALTPGKSYRTQIDTMMDIKEVLTSTDYIHQHKLNLSIQKFENGSKAVLSSISLNKILMTFEGYAADIKVGVINRDGSTLVTTHANYTKVWNFKTGQFLKSLDYTEPLKKVKKVKGYLSDISPNGDLIVLDGNLVFTSRTGEFLYKLEKETALYNTEISPNNKWIIAGGGKPGLGTTEPDTNAYVFESSTGKLKYKIPTDEAVTDCIFSGGSKYAAICMKTKTVILDIETGTLKFEMNRGGGLFYGSYVSFSPDEKKIIINQHGFVAVWEVETGRLLKELESLPNGVLFSPNGETVLFYERSFSATRFSVYEATSWTEMFSSGEGHNVAPTNAIVYSANSRYIRSYKNDTAFIWDVKTGSIVQTLVGHVGSVRLAVFSTDGDFVLTTGNDNNIRLWRRDNGEELLRLYVFDNEDYIHIHPSGLFDGSPAALEKVFFRRGKEIIELSQLKDRYYEPGLWEKVLKGEKLRDVRGLNDLKLEPEIELQEIKKGSLPIKLKKREGGYGKVSVFINGKEIVADARGRGFNDSKDNQLVQVKIENHPFLIPGADNEIIVKTWSEDGFVESRGARSVYSDPRKTNVSPPSFYGVVCGVSHYQNSQLNLTFAISDAKAISSAIHKGASNLFGPENTFIYTLTSPGEMLPTKANIEMVFSSIRAKAQPQDVVFVYLSGHGIVWGSESSDFYYLTSDANSLSAESYNDPAIRGLNTVSTAEFTNWINSIPALKQVMVIDACGSGKAVDNLLASRSVDASQVRAIDRMKDRTGMYLISGCAADAVSYEASRYGQGLLTYSLLQGMKGVALKENRFIDVVVLMQHARETVPVMAYGIGGIQTPQILIPKGGSFDIGLLNDQDKSNIPLSSPKPVFIRSLFIDSKAKRDKSGVSKSVNNMLSEEASKGANAVFLFFDSEEYSDGYALSGDYTIEAGGIEMEIVLSKGNDEIHRFNVKTQDINEAINQIREEISKLSLD